MSGWWWLCLLQNHRVMATAQLRRIESMRYWCCVCVLMLECNEAQQQNRSVNAVSALQLCASVAALG